MIIIPMLYNRFRKDIIVESYDAIFPTIKEKFPDEYVFILDIYPNSDKKYIITVCLLADGEFTGPIVSDIRKLMLDELNI